jgi:hypothetical protein
MQSMDPYNKAYILAATRNTTGKRGNILQPPTTPLDSTQASKI